MQLSVEIKHVNVTNGMALMNLDRYSNACQKWSTIKSCQGNKRYTNSKTDQLCGYWIIVIKLRNTVKDHVAP